MALHVDAGSERRVHAAADRIGVLTEARVLHEVPEDAEKQDDKKERHWKNPHEILDVICRNSGRPNQKTLRSGERIEIVQIAIANVGNHRRKKSHGQSVADVKRDADRDPLNAERRNERWDIVP